MREAPAARARLSDTLFVRLSVIVTEKQLRVQDGGLARDAIERLANVDDRI